MFRKLDHNTPRLSPQDCGLLKPLFLHQQSDLWAMQKMEASYDEPLAIADDQIVRTRVGLLCDKPGSGKSYTVLAHVLSRPKINNPAVLKSKSQSLGGYAEVEKTRTFARTVDTNLILAPRGTLKQWEQYIREMTSCTNYRVYYSMKDTDVDDVYGGKFDIAVVSEAGYKKIITERQRLFSSLFNRVIIDEADSIHIPSCDLPEAVFTWFVTATPHYLLTGTATTVVFRNIFFERGFINTDVIQNVIVESTPAFVDQSIKLPAYVESSVLIPRTALMNNLRAFVSADVMSAIDACDFGAAIGKLGCPTAENDDGIVAAVTSKFAGELASLGALLETAPTAAIAGITRRIRETEIKVDYIKARVRESDCCPIGLDTIVVKAFTPCCQNAFEFSNLIKALAKVGRCPLCKETLLPGNVVVCKAHDDAGGNGNGSGAGTSAAITNTSKPAALTAALKKAFDDNRDAKILIFSEWDMSMTTDVLQRMGLRHREVKGNTAVVNEVIRDFTVGTLSVLLLNACHFATGLNLQAATHIITLHKLSAERYTQLIGRAQRPVRTTQLQVVNIQFADE